MHLYVAKSGLMTWRYRLRIEGKESTFTLGECPIMKFEQDRLARMEAKEKFFKNLGLEWIEQQKEKWSQGRAEAVLNTLRHDDIPAISLGSLLAYVYSSSVKLK